MIEPPEKKTKISRKTCSDLSESLFPVNRDRLRRQSGTQKPVSGEPEDATIRNVFFILYLRRLGLHDMLFRSFQAKTKQTSSAAPRGGACLNRRRSCGQATTGGLNVGPRPRSTVSLPVAVTAAMQNTSARNFIRR